MTSVVNEILSNADYFVLLFFRVGALVISSPIFGRNIIPTPAKIAFIGALTYLFFLTGPAPGVIVYSSLFSYFLLLFREIMIGLALAYITNLFFILPYVAGQMIDMQIGFGVVNVYDPQNNTQVPLVGNLLNIILLIMFFLVNGHQRLIYIIFLTLESLPAGTVAVSPEIGLIMLEIFANAFTIGVMTALPVLASGIILEFAFGTLVRTVPQMNMFVVGIPLKVAVGFLLLLIVIPAFSNYSEEIFSRMFSAMDLMFAAFRGAV